VTRHRIVATVFAVVLAAACSFDYAASSPDGDAASVASSVEGMQLLGKLETGMRRGVAPVVPSGRGLAGTPTGLMVCLGHEPVGRVPRNDAVVGCDRQLGNGVIQPIEYTPENSPEFAAFVQPMIEGKDDVIMSSVEMAIARCWQGRCGASGFGNWASIIFMGEPRTLEEAPPRTLDFDGRTIRLIRLSGWAELTPSPDGNAYAYDLTWEFYGR